MDNFIEKQAPLNAIIFAYYMNFIPYYTNLFMFLFIFISVVFFTSKMAGRLEIIAMISSGISFNRLMFPYFISALLLGILSFVLSNFIIPPANAVRLKFENTYINGTYYHSGRNIHKQISPGVFLYVENFNTLNNSANQFSLEKYSKKEMVSKLMAPRAIWDSTKNKWHLTQYYIRNINGDKQRIIEGRNLDTAVNITPKDFKRRDAEKSTMNYRELNEYISEIKLRGESNLNTYLLEKNQRWAFPFSTFILTLIGVSLASKKTRGGTGMNIGIGILISFAYIFLMRMSAQFSIKGNLSPVLSAWIPNLIFLILGGFLYRIAPK
jgi:lipopolysaccharide export system permease protein